MIRIESDALFAVLGPGGEHWIKDNYDATNGGVCLHGAIRRCQQVPGDAYLIEEVAILQGWGPGWNDDERRDWWDIHERIVLGIEVTDAHLAETFGPQWEAIVALVRRAAILTVDEIERMAAMTRVSAAWEAVRMSAAAAGYATMEFARRAAATAACAARNAATATGSATREAARDAVGDAVGAVALRDRIGLYSYAAEHYEALYTAEHYEALTRPWRTVIGPVHPEDDDWRTREPVDVLCTAEALVTCENGG